MVFLLYIESHPLQSYKEEHGGNNLVHCDAFEAVLDNAHMTRASCDFVI